VNNPLLKRAVAELIGTAMLLAAVVGSGIMGERLAAGNTAIVLLANTIATGAALVALILTFGPISGAHFNPAVTLADAWQQGLAWRDLPVYILAQLGGAFAGVAVAHLMFDLPMFFASHKTVDAPAFIVAQLAGAFAATALFSWLIPSVRRDADSVIVPHERG
jgi:glycerol uptake facilitator-like aquaporin